MSPTPGAALSLGEIAASVVRIETQVERLVVDVSTLTAQVRDHDQWRWRVAGAVGALGTVAGAAVTYLTTH